VPIAMHVVQRLWNVNMRGRLSEGTLLDLDEDVAADAIPLHVSCMEVGALLQKQDISLTETTLMRMLYALPATHIKRAAIVSQSDLETFTTEFMCLFELMTKDNKVDAKNSLPESLGNFLKALTDAQNYAIGTKDKGDEPTGFFAKATAKVSEVLNPDKVKEEEKEKESWEQLLEEETGSSHNLLDQLSDACMIDGSGLVRVGETHMDHVLLKYGAETGKTAKKTLSTLWDTTVEAVLKAIEKDEPDVINYAIEFSLARRLLLTVVEVAALSVKDQNDPMLKYAIEQRLGGDEFAPFVDRETLLAQPQCGGCSRIGGTKFTCSRCKVTKYCGANCQRGHWKVHKPFCVAAPKPDAAE